jgi:electron-transferring-flavoprotein dehydrogenase
MTDRPSMEVDIVCVGFGPAMGGFLTTLAPKLTGLSSPPQVICYERAEGLGFGVSGVVTRARGIRESFPDLDISQIPMAANVGEEKVLYLLDPLGASRRKPSVKALDMAIRASGRPDRFAVELPYTPAFLHKAGGLVLSIGQFNQWVGEQLMMSGAVQIWPGMPVAEPLIENGAVVGVRLASQSGMPGMDILAKLTVVADGPVGPVSRKIDEVLGTPPGFERNEWAVGSKMVIELPEAVDLAPGTVFHTLGYPEPEIFGFFYVLPDRMASAGIFVPSWFDNPVRTSYRYLQHFIQHPYIERFVKGGRLRSWGAKTLMESGRRGEPFLVGHGYARIGECSGSTNVLTGSGVDEAWTTGIQLAQGVAELLEGNAPFTRKNLERAYVARRRASWVEKEGRIAEHARNGFQRGFVGGLIGMGLAGLTHGQVVIHDTPKPTPKRLPTIEEYFADRIPKHEIQSIIEQARTDGVALHDRLMDRAGWPAIAYDGQLLVTHQDALLMGGKVQAAPGFEDHVEFLHRELCETCHAQVCVEICSGEAISPNKDGGGAPIFDREKCVHCGACLWNCSREIGHSGRTNIEFRAGGGGLHSVEN